MNKIFQYCSVLLFSVLTLALGSCTEEYEYSAAKVEGEQVYFSNVLPTVQNLSSDSTSFTISLNRVVTDDELAVNLTLSDSSKIYSIPASVTFAEGASKVDFKVSYDPSKLEYEKFNTVSIAIADANYTTPYGNSTYTFQAGMPSPYVSLGIGKFEDNNLVSGYAEVEIMQSKLRPNEFRIMHPYDEIAEFMGSDGGYTTYPDQYPEYLQVYVLNAGDEYPCGTGATAAEDGMVYFDEACIGFDLLKLGSPTYIWHPALLQGGDVTHNRVLGWQADGKPGQIQLAPYYIEPETMQGASMASQDGGIVITFPGYSPKDYSVDLTYLGAFSSADGESYAMGNVTLGADIDEAKVAVVEGTDADAAVTQVLSGQVETTTVTASGEVRIPCSYSGDCTMVALGYADGELQNYSAASFTFSLEPSEWKSLGTGLYTDHVFCLNLRDQQGNVAPPVTYQVEVQENTKTPGVYRVMTPYAPDVYGYEGDFGYDDSKKYNITIDAHDPDHVMITGQPLGFYDGDDALLIATIGGLNYDYALPQYGDETFDMLKDAGYINGTLKNGTITFPAGELLYSWTSYYSQGKAGVVNDKEATTVLVLPDAVSAPAKAKAMKAKAAAKRKTYSVKYGSVRKAKVKKVKKPAIFLSKGRFSKNMIKF